jgi:hypothetical protein
MAMRAPKTLRDSMYRAGLRRAVYHANPSWAGSSVGRSGGGPDGKA